MVGSKNRSQPASRAISQPLLSPLFFRGNYQDVLELALGGGVQLDDAEFPFFIGALAFNARREEAEGAYRTRSGSLPLAARVACRFYLGIAHCRHGDLERGRVHLAENVGVARRSREPLTRFYVMQGLGFYRYITSRFRPALRAAERAWVAAVGAGFDYGRALAGDLSGHSLVQTGAIHAGIARLEEAVEVAARMGDGGLVHSIQMSRIVYRAQFGLNPESALVELEQAREELSPQNTHALANLLLEKANQLLLRGRLKEASRALEETSTRIYRAQHRRYGNLLSLRWAELSYRRGEYAAALHTVRSTRASLDEQRDLPLRVMALGLERKVLQKLEPEDPATELTQRLEKLTRKSARAISVGILNPDEVKEDALGKVFKELTFRRSPAEKLESVLDSGYFGRVHEALNLTHSSRAIVVVPGGRGYLLIDGGEVRYRERGLSRQILDLLRELREGERSREELVERLWGYAYHPLRHDAALYTAVARAREILGEQAYWLEATEGGYRLWPGVLLLEVLESRHPGVTPRDKTRHNETSSASSESKNQLNYRQIQILDYFKQERFIGATLTLAKRLNVSEMTLRRDFSLLMNQGYVKKTGRARSTRYELISSVPHATAPSYEDFN